MSELDRYLDDLGARLDWRARDGDHRRAWSRSSRRGR